MRRIRRSLAVLLVLAIPAGAVSVAGAVANPTVTVTVTKSAIGVEGAFVALLGMGAQNAFVTDETGAVSVAVPDGDYHLSVSAPGSQVHTAELTVAGADVDHPVALVDSGNPFEGLGAFGAQTSGIVADGLSGVFYLSTTSIPSLYRTGDYGGTWAPVTISTDDPLLGIDGSTSAATPATSGFPGEVATVVGNTVWFSRDFGNTWAPIPAPPMGNGGALLWGHVGARSVLFAVNGSNTEVSYVVMPVGPDTTFPSAFTTMVASYKDAGGDEVAIGRGATAPVFAVADAAGGDVHLFEVDETPSGDDPTTLLPGAAPGAAPTFLRIGGPAQGEALVTGAAPETVLAYSDAANGGKGAATMTSWADPDGDTTFGWVSTSTTVFHNQDDDGVNAALDRFNQDPGACGGMEGSIGSVSPIGMEGTVSMCWVTQEGADLDELHVRQVRGINNNTGMAFDAGYDGATNLVLISGDGEKGAAKSAQQATDQGGNPINRPSFPQWPTKASGGTDAGSGGVAIEGIDAAVVKDTAYGPGGDSQIATALSFTGGGRVIASVDGGSSWTDAAYEGSAAVDWWAGATAGRAWILTGAASGGNILTGSDVAADEADPAALEDDMLTVMGPGSSGFPGTGSADFGFGDGSAGLSAIVGLAGTDIAYAGVATNGGGGSLRQVTLSGSRESVPDDRSAAMSSTGLSTIDHPVTALANCPADGSAASASDVVYAALGESAGGAADGGIAIVSDASTATPSVAMAVDSATGAALEGDFNEVRADCAEGVVWAGSSSGAAPMSVMGPPPLGLWRSSDGGVTFKRWAIDEVSGGEPVGSSFNEVETLAVSDSPDPAEPDQVLIVSPQGDVAVSQDGGSTFFLANDPSDEDGRSFGGERPGDIELPPEEPEVAAIAAASGSNAALLGSGSGLFDAAVLDATAPGAPGLAALAATTLAPSVRLSWSAGQDSQSGVAGYVVYAKKMKLNATSFTSFAAVKSTTGRAADIPLPAGYTVCFVVKTRNGVGLLSASSNMRCTTAPADDRALTAASFVRKSQTGNYLNTFSEATAAGARLTLPIAGAKKVLLVVQRCPGCGVVDVFVGTRLVLNDLNLNAASVVRKVVVTITLPATLTGTLMVRVVSSGKPVRVDGASTLR